MRTPTLTMVYVPYVERQTPPEQPVRPPTSPPAAPEVANPIATRPATHTEDDVNMVS